MRPHSTSGGQRGRIFAIECLKVDGTHDRTSPGVIAVLELVARVTVRFAPAAVTVACDGDHDTE
jgi:hypothetical protein